MTPEQRLALYAVAMATAGLALLTVANHLRKEDQ